MKYGYCRISRKTQNIDRQESNILSIYPDALIVKEAFTGTTVNRPQWNKLYANVKSGDVIIFDSVSRMSRDASDGFRLYSELFSKGVELIFIKEPHINTSTYRDAMDKQINTVSTGDIDTDELMEGITKAINKYMMRLAEKQVMLAFEQAEKEVDDLHQRTKEGIRQVKHRNELIKAGIIDGQIKQIGQKTGAKLTTKKSIAAKQIIRKHYRQFGGSLTGEECIKQAGISSNSFYKYVSEIKAEMENQ